MIEKLKRTESDTYKWIDEGECNWETKKDYLQCIILGFCGCGDPDSVMIYIRDILQRLDKNDWRDGDYEDYGYMFIIYWLNEKDYAEHGTTARCSWLTDKGKELLNDINWVIENENE